MTYNYDIIKIMLDMLLLLYYIVTNKVKKPAGGYRRGKEGGKMKKGFYTYEGKISCDPIVDRESLFCALHELGHKHCQHHYLGAGMIDLRDVRRECEAWAYARKCLTSAIHPEMEGFAVACVETYNSQASAIWGEWLETAEILTLIRRENET